MGASHGEFVKYPRTPHLFGSKGTSDDKHRPQQSEPDLFGGNASGRAQAGAGIARSGGSSGRGGWVAWDACQPLPRFGTMATCRSVRHNATEVF